MSLDVPAENSNGSNPSSNSNDGPALGAGRVIPNSQMIFWSCLVGLVGGLMAIIYYFVLDGMIRLVWTKLCGIDWLNQSLMPMFQPRVLIVTTIGGFCVGLVLKFIGAPRGGARFALGIPHQRGLESFDMRRRCRRLLRR